MNDDSKDVPNQRGTSSGEIGQNPVEMRYKQPQGQSDDAKDDPKAGGKGIGEKTAE